MLQPTEKEARLLELCREQHIHVELIATILTKDFYTEANDENNNESHRHYYQKSYQVFNAFYNEMKDQNRE